MNSTTRQFERHMEDVTRSKATADHRNRVGKIVQEAQLADHEDSLSERMEDALFSDMSQTDTQDFLHEFGGGVSKGPPRGGWPRFDPVTGKRLASPQILTSVSPL